MRIPTTVYIGYTSAIINKFTPATGTYTVVFQDGMEKISHNTRVSGCIVSNRGQLLLTSLRANRGNNTGIRYINSAPN